MLNVCHCNVSALNGTASLSPDLSTQTEDYSCIYDLIINEIPSPDVNVDAPLQFQPALLDYNEYVGRIGVGKVDNGVIRVNAEAQILNHHESDRHQKVRISKLYEFEGLDEPLDILKYV